MDFRDKIAFLCFNSMAKSFHTGETHMHPESHLASLSEKHQKLDKIILKEELRPSPDSVILNGLKKEKLKLKDEMERFRQVG